MIGRAYRLIRCIIPNTGVSDFASNFRYSSKIEIPLLHFAIGSRGPDRHSSIIRQGLNERHSIGGKGGAAIH